MTSSSQGPTHPEGDLGGGRSDRGPATNVPGKQQPGGALPPYEGRKTEAEPEQEGGTYRDGARVGGATGPVDDDEFKADRPSDPPGGPTASPSDEQPAAQMPESAPSDPGVDLTAHVPGTPTGESGGS